MRRPPFLPFFLLLALVARGETAAPKIVERYKQMLAANPVEGVALDRLWKIYFDDGQTTRLIEDYKREGTFASEMVLGHLLRKAGQSEAAVAAYRRARKLDEKSALPPLELGRVESELGRARGAAAEFENAAGLVAADDPRLPEILMQLGQAWLAAGDAEKAAGAWERTVALNPNDLELHRRLAETYEQNFLPDRAIAHLEFLDAHAPPADRALALQQLARVHQSAGRQDAAITALEKALALTTPGNWLRAELESQLIRLHQRYHRTAELEERWKKNAVENPRDLGARLQLVNLYERLGDLAQQRTWLESLVELAPKNPDYRLKLARLFVQMDQPEAAAARFDELLREQPANADFVFERAKLDVQRDDGAAARGRIAALLAARKNDESIRAKALEFFQRHRLFDSLEAHLREDAASEAEEPIVALANFYFSQHREPDARRALGRLVRPVEAAEKRAATHVRIAQILRTQNLLPEAIEELGKAVELTPPAREIHLLMGEMQAARGDHAAAQTEFKKAVSLSKTEAERSAADQKLFESFRSRAAADAAAQSGIANSGSGPRLRSAPLTMPAWLLERGGTEPNPELGKFIAAMQHESAAQPTENGWLRLARWHSWNRNAKAALAAAGEALTLNPDSIAAHELLLKLQTAEGPSPLAVQTLKKLAEIDPANRANYERRAGQIEIQSGRVAEALSIFQELAKSGPGNLDALTDLALTQQRAERWPEALATWRQVYALSPVSRKKEAFTPLLRVLERLEMHQQSAEMQLKAVETEADARERFALFGELLAHCGKHGLLDWLRAQFERRRQLRADDYFTEVALGRILKASGNAAAAFEVLADASYAAPDQAAALPELIHEAEELRKLDAAVKLQEQLLRIVPQEQPAAFEKLAQLQEKNSDIDEAARTWDRIAAKFPRDAAALNHAVEFQLQWGTKPRAIELLRKARAVEPANLRTLAALSELDLEAGETAEAEACLEEILRGTTAEKSGDPLRFPALKPTEPGRLQTAYLATVGQRSGRPSPATMRALRRFWVDETAEPKSDRDTRLNAIRQLAQLTRADANPMTRARWIQRWRGEHDAPSEALWALFYAGAGEAALDRVEAMMTGDARDANAAQAFIWIALQTRQFARLAEWLGDKRRTPSERDFLFVALGQELDAGAGKIDPALLGTLFAEGTRLRLWQAAMLFAARNDFREAVDLGKRVFESAATQRAAYGLELAHWHLFLGEIAQARAVLKLAIETPAESFESSGAAALREYFLLLPESERTAFVDSHLGAIDERKQPLHAAIAGALLHGLAGDEASARAALERLLAMRAIAGLELDEPGSSGARYWRFLLNSGAQLQSWKLDALAGFLWERALADPALVALQGEHAAGTARDVQQRLCALRVATASPEEMEPWLECFARLSPSDGLLPLAGTLSSIGAHAAAIEIYRRIWERDPGELDALRNLLNACRTGGDDETAEMALRNALSRETLDANSRREFTLQFADLLDRSGRPEEARALLVFALQKTPDDARLLHRAALAHETSGQPDAAAAAYRKLLTVEPANIAARLALAVILESQKHDGEALAILKESRAPEVDARLAQLCARTSRPDEALAVLDRIAPPHHVAAALAAASAFAAKGDRENARAAVQGALLRSTDSRLDFPLQCKLIELLAPDETAAARRELRRLRRFTSESPALLGSYLEFALAQAPRLGLQAEFEAELRELWAEGAGPISAGLTVLTAQLGANDATATATVDRLLAREDAGDAWLGRAAAALEKAGRNELLARVQQRLAQTAPLNEQNGLSLARTLQKLGRPAEARSALEILAARAAVTEELAGKVAPVFVELGEPKRAASLFAQALREDSLARRWPVLLEFARLQTSMRDFTGARKTLRVAFQNPANHEFSAVVAWLVASERLGKVDAAAAELRLATPRLAELRRALFAYFEKSGQAAEAIALVDAHPEILRADMIARVRALAGKSGDFARAATLLENLAAQAPAAADVSLQLALFFGDWAASELAQAKPEAALAHFQKARELRPEIWDIALRLSALQNERGDRKSALETIESFLAVAKDRGEIEKAREQLAKLKAGA